MINDEITMLAAKNEYIEARLDQAVAIIMLAEDYKDNVPDGTTLLVAAGVILEVGVL